jgi:hypothetical protein
MHSIKKIKAFILDFVTICIKVNKFQLHNCSVFCVSG